MTSKPFVERDHVTEIGDLRDVEVFGDQRRQGVAAGIETDGVDLHSGGILRRQRHRRAMGTLGKPSLIVGSLWANAGSNPVTMAIAVDGVQG